MEYFQIGPILGTEKRQLPAAYNLLRTLFHHCNHSCLFVPRQERSMHYVTTPRKRLKNCMARVC